MNQRKEAYESEIYEYEDEGESGYIDDTAYADENELILNRMIEYFSTKNPQPFNLIEKRMLTKEDFLDTYGMQYLISEGVSGDQMEELLYQFYITMWGYGKLEPYLNDDSISDIRIVNYDNVRIKRYGKREGVPVRFKNNDEVDQYISRIAMLNKQNISDQNALSVFTDVENNEKNRLRINVITKFVSSVGHGYLQIRKIPKIKPSKEQLIHDGYFTSKIEEYLVKRFCSEDVIHGMMFLGAGGSGKTVGMNYMIDHIREDMSGLVVQESDELFSDSHPEFMFTHIVTNNGEGKVQYTLRDLAKKGLLIDLDVFMIGEVKGAEAFDLINAAYTGTRCMCSVHAFSTEEAIDKLVHYAKYETDIPAVEVKKMMRHLDTLVFVKNYKIREISEIIDFDEKKQDFIYRTWKFNERGEPE